LRGPETTDSFQSASRFKSEERDVAIEFRWGRNDDNRLPGLAHDLVGRRVAVTAALGTTPAAATRVVATELPMVFVAGSDPVQSGLVALDRPGGNDAGISTMNTDIGSTGRPSPPGTWWPAQTFDQSGAGAHDGEARSCHDGGSERQPRGLRVPSERSGQAHRGIRSRGRRHLG